MKLKLSRVIIPIIISSLLLTGVYAVNVSDLDRNTKDEAGKNKKIEHTLLSLNPDKFEVEYTKTDAVSIINRKGFTPQNASISLMKDRVSNQIYWEVIWEVNDKTFLFGVDSQRGRIVKMWTERYEKTPKKIEESNVRDIAKRKAKELYGKLPNNIGPSIAKRCNISKGKFVHKVFWKQTINEIEVEDSYVLMTLDPSGNIVGFKYCWQNINVNTEPKISKATALKNAKRNLLTSSHSLIKNRVKNTNEDNISISLSIKRKSEDGSLIDHVPTGKYKLVWDVSFKSNKGEINGLIDAKTGELIRIELTK